MNEGIRMMEANNWPELTSVMRPQWEAGHWSQRLGGAERGQSGHWTGTGHMGLGSEGSRGSSVEKCRIQRNMRRGWRVVRSKCRRRQMDGVRMFRRDDSRRGGGDEEWGGHRSDGG